MTGIPPIIPTEAPKGLPAFIKSIDRHFVVAAVIMGLMAGGWAMAVKFLKVVVSKEAIAWPANVVVGDDFRLRSLPEKIGPFEMVSGDGELDYDREGKPKRDGKPDGEIIHQKDLLETMGVGTKYDSERYGARKSNWYVSRVYRDTRVPDNQNRFYKYWYLDITYYTGGMDTIPHVPEICLVAGGASGLETKEFQFDLSAISGKAPAPWDGNLTFHRTLYEFQEPSRPDIVHKYVQYYIFSLNGLPETSRDNVRIKLTWPTTRYCYFAKVQFAPRSSINESDYEECAKRAREFLENAMPEILKTLPTRAEVERMNQS